MDNLDRAIVRELQADGRISVQELSQRVGLSPSPCARRIRMLEDAGVIAGYHALVDEVKAGFAFSVFVSVKLDRQVDDTLKVFEDAVRAHPEVVDCWLMTGNRDYLLRIAVRDIAEFESFLTGKLTKLSIVASIESSIPLRRVKSGISRSR
ncbi:Lrp/AsnC family transcriptional regulator [Aurantimonas sp. C2-6-R+9]|uniref:Lrp/AsnC family transcriptional regulator n=1 Tax=unclassified Aurantimonas TaxID=2638230 RepID=UPI002E187F83|nr:MULTISPECIES: Lrp/AsnC family transcriptional regulator [unclassified Aurantimonas]MEC5293289.1 Lrp/AsnC family transcriptional regulator [Aurantimonas sp. C2-3-R2]MEC5383440.1 Lrp/AsnC family transcriptional regulator [Aurantimonas sp. C2-6-R+9]MEC5414383.1 Lrp/AsnC family transcriptional regulator [Aurantimonas sp. C2-4-R8]